MCWCNDHPDVDLEKTVGIIEGHAYPLLYACQLSTGERLLALHNPWGKTEWKGEWSDHSPLWTEQAKKEVARFRGQVETHTAENGAIVEACTAVNDATTAMHTHTNTNYTISIYRRLEPMLLTMARSGCASRTILSTSAMCRFATSTTTGWWKAVWMSSNERSRSYLLMAQCAICGTLPLNRMHLGRRAPRLAYSHCPCQ